MSDSPTKTLFQKIYDGEINSEILYKDELVFVIKDIHPQAKIHLLIIPIEPIQTVSDLESKHELTAGRLFTVARKMAEQFNISDKGYRLIVNCKADGGQEVPHLHMHLLGGEKLGPMITRK
jgi:histidine triad (HIT) family protein